MKNWFYFLVVVSLLFSASLFAESNLTDIPEAELLDAYLEEQPTSRSREAIAPAEPPTTQVSNGQAVEFRKVQDSDGVEIYEVVPAQSAHTEETMATEPEAVITSEVEGQRSQDIEELEVIEIDSYNEEITEIEASDVEDVQVTTHVNKHDHIYCQQNPFAKECLYAPYLSRCKQDPESLKCHTQLEKFEHFCETFPRAYKCKKAQFAATCKQQPDLNECKTFTERYCQKYPKAIFCDWN